MTDPRQTRGNAAPMVGQFVAHSDDADATSRTAGLRTSSNHITTHMAPRTATPEGGSIMVQQHRNGAVQRGAKRGPVMLRRLRNASPLLLIAVAHLSFLMQGAMLGCSFTALAGSSVNTDEDSPNSYTCSCRCGARPILSIRVGATLDDAEGPQVSDPDGATDLDLGGTNAGVRFTSVAIPPGAVITAANVQFTADQAFGADNTTPINLEVFAEAADNAPAFGANVVNNLGLLPRTSASVGWNIPPWSVSQAGPAQRTQDLSAVIQEIVNRPGWKSGNALVVIFAGVGAGRREAESFDGNPARAAVLTVQFDVAPVQALNVCMPEALNPNLTDANGVHHPAPQPDQLQADCEGRVQKTFGDLALACGYPAQCDCNLQPDSQRFNLSCNNPCDSVPLDPRCANFNPSQGTVGATNVPGDTPVCVVPVPSANLVLGPSAITAAMYGQQSECHVEGPATFEVGDEHKTTPAHGVIGLFGEPCPQGQCSVGLSYGLTMDPVTFEVRFHSDPVFKDLAATGASVADAAQVDATGSGQVGAQQTDSSVRGRRNSDTRAYVMTNPEALDVFVGWDEHACALVGDLAGSVGADEEGDQNLTAAVSLEGTIVNEPPRASAGQDQVVECTSTDGARLLLDGNGSGDPESNAVLFSWFRDRRAGQPVGFGQTLEVQQELGGTASYVLRVIDAFGQSDEDTMTARVVDTTAPALSVSVSPTSLWPPNHKLVPIAVTLGASDACDANLTLRLVSITSNEGDLANGSGHTSPDIQDAQFGTDDRQFLLRAERGGGGVGRIYTITYEARDANGNVTTSQATVRVPAN
jgi:hypothetical protein